MPRSVLVASSERSRARGDIGGIGALLVRDDLHDRLIARASEVLQQGLLEPYYALIGSRLWVETSRRDIAPDVTVMRAQRPTVEVSGTALAARRSRNVCEYGVSVVSWNTRRMFRRTAPRWVTTSNPAVPGATSVPWTGFWLITDPAGTVALDSAADTMNASKP